jgi:hypothetical protein
MLGKPLKNKEMRRIDRRAQAGHTHPDQGGVLDAEGAWTDQLAKNHFFEQIVEKGGKLGQAEWASQKQQYCERPCEEQGKQQQQSRPKGLKSGKGPRAEG